MKSTLFQQNMANTATIAITLSKSSYNLLQLEKTR